MKCYVAPEIQNVDESQPGYQTFPLERYFEILAVQKSIEIINLKVGNNDEAYFLNEVNACLKRHSIAYRYTSK